ncbi:hypothetical protein BU23DRAFT_495667 [Bimuria novae-zelandiae CBS 107.79]|uniref:Uncharacterized protein n=1 Tax=Bimuria novae-zelandiae CBS 107.79 TaxID=1447943 RepID=A0A6A5W479_9PLEO|nr:hypothetical protein BU23DRAFT_495667 [Bimuria novae-zelandiae CBS 107.79]
MTTTTICKEQEARAGSTYPVADAPPAYTGPRATNPQSLADDVHADMVNLSKGNLQETISVPMVHSTETIYFKKLFSKNRKLVTQSVTVRKMTRERYLKHYAKDTEGNYVGTEAPAVDAGLVFVQSKSTTEDLLQQVRKVAFGKEHYANDFSDGLIMGSVLGDGFALNSGPRSSKK